MTKVFISPRFNSRDKGDGGIRRVVEAQLKHLPRYGVTVVDDPEEADVIHVHADNWVDTKRRIPVVAQCHGLYWLSESDQYEWEPWCHAVNKTVMETMLNADAVIAVSDWVAQAIRRGTGIPAEVIYHGVDTDTPDGWHPPPEEDGHKGYVLWNKTRIDAICDPQPVSDLARRRPQVNFVTTFGDRLPNVMTTDKLPPDAAKDLVRHAGVYLCTTRETFGIGTLEAMACGVPILGWRWGGQREIVEHEQTGYLARPGDTDDLERGLDYCLEHRDRLSENARVVAEKLWSWDRPTEKLALLYKNLVKNQPTVKVSVVVPAYNMAATLPRTIVSILDQQKPPSFEIVIVDDASTDETGDVADQLAATLKPDTIRVIHNPKNLYLAGALNVGIDAARGEYVIPLDADNELGPQALNVLAQLMDSDRSLDIAYGKMRVIEEIENGRDYVSDWPPKQASWEGQMQHMNQCPSTSMFRKKVWERVGGYRTRCRTAEDADFWTRALSYGARARRATDLTTLIYHDRPDSMSRTNRNWDWTAWYTWARLPDLRLPAVLSEPGHIRVPSFEPVQVDVIIPVGSGHVKYLPDALDSLQAQTFRNWEAHVVFDDPFEDRDQRDLVTERLLPAWIRRSDTFDYANGIYGGMGPAHARNVGLDKARSRFVFFLDADDYLHPSALADMIAAYYQAGIPDAYIYSDYRKAETGEIVAVRDWSCEALMGQLIHPVSVLVPRSLIDNDKWKIRFDDKLDAWEDWDFFMSLAANGGCGIRVPRPLLYYRTTAGNRREAQYARREELTVNFRAKWREYYDGEKELMGCGCGGGRAGSVPATMATGGPATFVATAAPNAPGKATVVVEYVGKAVAPVTYRGLASGKEYRVGLEDPFRVIEIDARDAMHFRKRPEFVVHDGVTSRSVPTDELVLESAGPPPREAVAA